MRLSLNSININIFQRNMKHLWAMIFMLLFRFTGGHEDRPLWGRGHHEDRPGGDLRPGPVHPQVLQPRGGHPAMQRHRVRPRCGNPHQAADKGTVSRVQEDFENMLIALMWMVDGLLLLFLSFLSFLSIQACRL